MKPLHQTGKLTIVLTGGGSGGHITPILAVAAALKTRNSTLRLVYVGQRGDPLSDVPAQDPNIDAVYSVHAGKFRRYKTLGWRQIFYPKINLLNIRDLFYIGFGIIESWFLLRRLKPRVIFTRGGYVSVPVAVAGHSLHVPYVTHDSDSTPSLANRLIAKHAAIHAVALPVEVYPYQRAKTVMTGIPLGQTYQPVTPALQARYRRTIGVPADAVLLLVTGGGNGAHRLNQAVLASVPALLDAHQKLVIIHNSGRELAADLQMAYAQVLSPEQLKRVLVKGFLNDLYQYSGAADLVIARGGATNIAELAVQRKACIIIPSPQLIWNVKNNQLLRDRGAIVQVTEAEAAQAGYLAKVISTLLTDASKRQQLADCLAELGTVNAAERVADILLNLANGQAAR